MSDTEKVTIEKAEYDELLGDQKFLYALQSAGVDSWEGYEEAQNLIED